MATFSVIDIDCTYTNTHAHKSYTCTHTRGMMKLVVSSRACFLIIIFCIYTREHTREHTKEHTKERTKEHTKEHTREHTREHASHQHTPDITSLPDQL